MFEGDMHKVRAWVREVRDLTGLGCEDAFTDKVLMVLTIGKELVSFKKRVGFLKRSIPKLRILCQIKHVFGTENYILYNLSVRKRSLGLYIYI